MDKPFELYIGYKDVAIKTGRILLGDGNVNTGDYYVEFAKVPELKSLGKMFIRKDQLDSFLNILQKMKEVDCTN